MVFIDGMLEADKYGLNMEYLAEFIKNIKHGDSVGLAVNNALMEWDI